MHLSSLLRSAAQPKRWLRAAGAAVVAIGAIVAATLLGFGPAASAHRRGSALAKSCPAPSLVTATLRQPIKKASSAVISYDEDTALAGSRLTCTYTTKTGKVITYTLSSNANVVAIVAAEESAFGTDETFSGGAGFDHAVKASHVIPAFGTAKIAWTLKEGGLLSVLYGRTHLMIIAPNATPAEMEALARSTQGTPLRNLKVDRAN